MIVTTLGNVSVIYSTLVSLLPIFSGEYRGHVRECPQGGARQRGDPVVVVYVVRPSQRLQEAATHGYDSTSTTTAQEPVLFLGHHEHCHAGGCRVRTLPGNPRKSWGEIVILGVS